MTRRQGFKPCAMAALAAVLSTQAAVAQSQSTGNTATDASGAGATAAPASSIGREPLTLNSGGPQAAKPFGTEGTRWLEFGGLVADNFKDSVDTNLHARFSEFLAKDVEVGR